MFIIDATDKEQKFNDFDQAKEWLRSQLGEKDHLKESDDLLELLDAFGFELLGLETDEARIFALANFLKVDVSELEATSYDDKSIEYGSEQYLVVTDDEADELWDEDLENYIEECILHELPEQYQGYFDNEKFKRDARIDGRAHSLNRYDGGEEFITVDNQEFYIYRQN